MKEPCVLSSGLGKNVVPLVVRRSGRSDTGHLRVEESDIYQFLKHLLIKEKAKGKESFIAFLHTNARRVLPEHIIRMELSHVHRSK